MKNNFVQIFTTTATKKEAQKIADVLIRHKFAGCIQILGPIESHYIWKGKQGNTKEFLCIIKTKLTLYAKIEKAVRKIHSYEVPELIALPINKGGKDYFNWLDSNLL